MDEDQREFAEFYAAAWDDCLRIVTLSVGNRALGEDLVAEVFIKAWASWRKVRGLTEPRAWIIRSALNAHVSWWRRHRREVALGSHDHTAATGGDLALLIQAALLKAGSVDPTAVRNAFASLANVQGVSGTISYAGAPEKGVPKKDVFIIKYVNGKQQCVTHFYPTKVVSLK